MPMDHRWRMKKRAFDGTQELDGAPIVPNGIPDSNRQHTLSSPFDSQNLQNMLLSKTPSAL